MAIEEEDRPIVISLNARLRSFLNDYGEKGKIVLQAAVMRAKEVYSNGENSLGDFDYKGLKKFLESMGYEYNPKAILTVMERKYGLIETSYRSSKQHWWRFYDFSAIERELNLSEKLEEDDSRRIIKAMYASLEPMRMVDILKKLAIKSRLDYADKKLFRKIAFEDLIHVEEVLRRMTERESEFQDEIRMLKDILRLTEEISIKLIRER